MSKDALMQKAEQLHRELNNLQAHAQARGPEEAEYVIIQLRKLVEKAEEVKKMVAARGY